MPTATVAPIYEGKAKQLFAEANQLRVVFKDDATAFNGQKHSTFAGKGQLNAAISACLFQQLAQHGLPTCFIQQGSQSNELVYQPLEMIPLEVVVRNVALGSFAKRYGIAANSALSQPLVETFLKRDDLNDPLIPASGVRALQLLPEGVVLDTLERWALSANTVLSAVFESVDIVCADFKLEFGVTPEGELRIADELSPDNFRLRDKTTGQILDKDTFRLEEGDLLERYTTVWQRLQGLSSQIELPLQPYTVQVMVTSRPNVLSPESRTLTERLKLSGFKTTERVLCNKQFAVTLQATHAQSAFEQAQTMATTVLANPVVEDAIVLPQVMPSR